MNLDDSIRTGFVDKRVQSFASLQPGFIINGNSQKVLGHLDRKIRESNRFWFSVAFITSSGVMSLHEALKQFCQNTNNQGKIFVSDYLGFTAPEALKKIKKNFEYLDVRMYRGNDYHGKGFLFQNQENFNLMVGSSNLTGDGISKNDELNLNVTCGENSKVVIDFIDLFEQKFQSAEAITDELIQAYEEEYYRRPNSQDIEDHVLDKKDDTGEISPFDFQQDALDRLNMYREEGKKKSIIISATGTGKTLISAFDVKNMQPKKMLFVVHRQKIAKKSLETFKKIIPSEEGIAFGMYSGDTMDSHADYLFSTVQTISRDKHLQKFSKNHFDYIIVDETHRAGAESYEKILKYFSPKFLLGMTATPERMDGRDVAKLFDHNIACEIRLRTAMEYEIVCPFHYFGILDVTVEDQIIEEEAAFNLLSSEERVKRIIEKIDEYGVDDGIIRGLVFCSKIEEAEQLSKIFNSYGRKSVCLSGGSSDQERDNAVELLEEENFEKKIEFIFSVDVFNEGIDIPRLNLVVMLRPTKSAIIFTQQLGRGLRKVREKKYLTVIDFIGNYKNNYQIPIALFGDTSYNKDELRRLIQSGSELIPGSSTVNFDKIAKEQIFKSITDTKFEQHKLMKREYELLKHQLGRSPMMVDFLENEKRDPYQFVKKYKSYFNFVNRVEQDITEKSLDRENKLLEYFSLKINDGKRILDSLILNELLDNTKVSLEEIKTKMKTRYNLPISDEVVSSVLDCLNFRFHTVSHNGRIVRVCDAFNYNLFKWENGYISTCTDFERLKRAGKVKEYLSDSTSFSVKTFERKLQDEEYLDGFFRYKKYTREDVLRILMWDKMEVPLNLGGYKLNAELNNMPIWVILHKADDVTHSQRYRDAFVNSGRFFWQTKNSRNLNSPEVVAIKNQQKSGLSIPFFLKKSDAEDDDEFYFLGFLSVDHQTISEDFIQDEEGKKKSIVNMEFVLDKPVESRLYEYLIGV